MASSGRLRTRIGVALLLGAAFGIFLWGPWHGPTIVSLSSSHGIDAGDLPGLALLTLAIALAPARPQGARAGPRWQAGRWTGPASTVVLGALLLVCVVDPPVEKSLVPAAGGTFDGATRHADAQQADPVNRWSHVALTFDGTMLRLYVNGSQVSSRATTGAILRTTRPLWIGGNSPYGEYFQGLIDEVRVYDRPLSRAEVRAEMSRPIRGTRVTSAPSLVGAYAFDRGSGTRAADASGTGNAGAINGATWTTRGRYGGALRFGGAGEVVRVPASASLDLRGAMTLSAWIWPSESQAGWRTILHRQTDVYFLMAGGGSSHPRLEALDDARVALLTAAAVLLCVALASGRARWAGGRRRLWWLPVALFLAGSVVDAALTPSDTLIGATVVALWFAVTASRRDEAVSIYLIAAVFTGVTVVSLTGQGGLELARDDGGNARSAALGLLLVTVGLVSALYRSRGGKQRAAETAAPKG
jgi:hypothetical protein